jgi:hypothetical protein
MWYLYPIHSIELTDEYRQRWTCNRRIDAITHYVMLIQKYKQNMYLLLKISLIFGALKLDHIHNFCGDNIKELTVLFLPFDDHYKIFLYYKYN